MTLTAKHRRLASDALGYDVDPELLVYHVAGYEGTGTGAMLARFEELCDRFEALGGRGCELADEIDALRMALAVRGEEV